MPTPAGLQNRKLPEGGDWVSLVHRGIPRAWMVAGIRWTRNCYLLNKRTRNVSQVTKKQQGQRLISVNCSWV